MTAKTDAQPIVELDARYSAGNAQPTGWDEARRLIGDAEIYWASTVRPDGRPHVTPVVAVWYDGALYFCAGPDEQKSKNLAQNADCLLTTGCNQFGEGMDLVVEGDVVTDHEHATLQRVADQFESKYGPDWHFEVRDGRFEHGPGPAVVYAVAPTVAYAFGKGERSGHTRFRF